MFEFYKKSFISQPEQNELFEIIKKNMLDFGVVVENKDREVWLNNLLTFLKKPDYYFYCFYKDGKIVGFCSIIVESEKATLCELELNEAVQHTRLIFAFIEFLINQEELKKYDTLYFGINKKNFQSNKTFRHLGAELIFENEKAYRYKLDRKCVEKYLKDLKNKKRA